MAVVPEDDDHSKYVFVIVAFLSLKPIVHLDSQENFLLGGLFTMASRLLDHWVFIFARHLSL